MSYTFRDASGTVKTARSRTVGGVELPYTDVVTAVMTVLDYGWAAVTVAQSLPNVPTGATHALLTVESGGGDLRYRQDGTSPIAVPTANANAGLLVAAGSSVQFALPLLTAVKVVAVSGTATINVEYAKYDS